MQRYLLVTKSVPAPWSASPSTSDTSAKVPANSSPPSASRAGLLWGSRLTPATIPHRWESSSAEPVAIILPLPLQPTGKIVLSLQAQAQAQQLAAAKLVRNETRQAAPDGRSGLWIGEAWLVRRRCDCEIVSKICRCNDEIAAALPQGLDTPRSWLIPRHHQPWQDLQLQVADFCKLQVSQNS